MTQTNMQAVTTPQERDAALAAALYHFGAPLGGVLPRHRGGRADPRTRRQDADCVRNRGSVVIGLVLAAIADPRTATELACGVGWWTP